MVHKENSSFIPGLVVCRRFYAEIVRPLLDRTHPGIIHAAAVLGPGSEVLGFDTDISPDHDWGPRVHLFLPDQDFDIAPNLSTMFEQELPNLFAGYMVRFEDRHRVKPSLIAGQWSSSKHGVEIVTLSAYANHLLGVGTQTEPDLLTWLSLPQQKLLSFTAGEVFHDDYAQLTQMRSRYAYYPEAIRIYLMASCWSRISEERAFVGRTGSVGDETGSVIVASRLMQDIMRLCFLCEGKYFTYSKWFGSAFRKLDSAQQMSAHLAAVANAGMWQKREAALCQCYLALDGIQKRYDASAPDILISSYFDRPYQVCNSDDHVEWFRSRISDPNLVRLPTMGSIDFICDNVPILNDTYLCRTIIKALVRTHLSMTDLDD